MTLLFPWQFVSTSNGNVNGLSHVGLIYVLLVFLSTRPLRRSRFFFNAPGYLLQYALHTVNDHKSFELK